MMKRILFVDDEPNVLGGLRRMLYPLRNQWQMVFAGSGREALQRLEESAFDIVVTDVRMPEMSGVELLAEVGQRFPQTIRIVLSGTAESALTLRTATLAHQYLMQALRRRDPSFHPGARLLGARDVGRSSPEATDFRHS